MGRLNYPGLHRIFIFLVDWQPMVFTWLAIYTVTIISPFSFLYVAMAHGPRHFQAHITQTGLALQLSFCIFPVFPSNIWKFLENPLFEVIRLNSRPPGLCGCFWKPCKKKKKKPPAFHHYIDNASAATSSAQKHRLCFINEPAEFCRWTKMHAVLIRMYA